MPRESPRMASEPPGPGSKALRTHTCCRALLSGPGYAAGSETGPRSPGPSGVVGQVAFWRLGVPRPKNHIFYRNEWFVGLAAFGMKAKQPLISRKCVACLPRFPRPPKNHLAKNHFGISLSNGFYDHPMEV